MDFISLEEIILQTKLGVPDAERQKPQRVIVSLKIMHPLNAAGETDDITETIDYAVLTEKIVALEKAERRTIERLAEDIATLVLRESKPKGGVEVTVRKFPPIPLQSVSVTIVRP